MFDLPSLTNLSKVVLGGEGSTLHIAAVKDLGKGGRCLVIRSFCSGELKAPADIPDWYRKPAAPQPRSEF